MVVAAVGTIAVLAAADALRGGPHAEPRPEAGTTTSARAPTLAETLRREAVVGFVLYSDDDCDVHSLLLPRLVDEIVRDESGNTFQMCRFEVHGGRIVAEDSRRRVDGLIARRGRVFAGTRVVLSKRDLMAAARRHPNVAGYDPGLPMRIRVTGLARLDVAEVAVGLEIRSRYLERQFLGALFRGRRIVAVAANFRGPYEHLVASPGGAFVASEDGTLFVRAGRSLDPPQALPTGSAVAFSPDERWLAYVTGVSIYLVGTPRNSEPGRILRLPVPAQDLVWEPGGPTIDTTTTAR